MGLYKKYLSHCPKTEETAFNLTPLISLKALYAGYSKVQVKYNTLAKTVYRICESAQIPGYKTNHSLCVSSATRLFQKGVDELLIVCGTGHCSIDGVQKYKRISENQHVDTSNILSSCTNGVESPHLHLKNAVQVINIIMSSISIPLCQAFLPQSILMDALALQSIC